MNKTSKKNADSKITIGVDVRPLQQGFREHAGRGTGRYTDELVRNLLEIQQERSLPFSLELVAPTPPAALESLMHDWMVLGKRTFESQVLFPRQVARTGVDMMHFFHHGDAPSRPSIPHVVTVLDLIPLRFPHLYTATKSNLRFKFARFLELQAIRKAQGLFAISEATKKDVVELLGVSPEKVQVTPLAINSSFSPDSASKLPAVVEPYLGQRQLLLYVGGIDPRKNVRFLIDILAGVYSEGQHRPLLLLAGNISQDDQYPLLKKKITELGMQDAVLELGRVSDEELLGLYQNVDAFLFPSLYEGFGFPVLEAMGCGCPVLAANNSSIPEVAGQAALLLEDNDLRSWVEAVSALLSFPELQKSYCEKGLLRAKEFSWKKTAEATIDGYARFLSLPKIDHQNAPQERYAVS